MSRIPFDPDAIRALAALLAETGLTEIEMAERDSRIRVVRGGAGRRGRAACAASARAASPALTGAGRSRTADDAQHPGAVLSPMVGVAYLSPEPGAPASSASARASPPARPCC